MRVLDLFSGIGGFSLGLERAGMETVAFCEIEPYCQKVLAKHWPGVPIYDDVRRLDADTLRSDGIAVDVICGGFPCQDISVAGKGVGLEGERSGLWFEYRRIIRDVRPEWVIVENVPAILSRGGSVVTNDLAALGYDCMWECIPACAVGAPHRRDRWWCIAYATSSRCEQSRLHIASDQTSARERADDQPSNEGETISNAKRDAIREQPGRQCGKNGASAAQSAIDGEAQSLANSVGMRELQSQGGECDEWRRVGNSGKDGGNANSTGLPLSRTKPVRANGQQGRRPTSSTDWWSFEPDVGRVANGVSKRVDRLKGLGNAVVPQIPEMIGKAIMEAVE